MLYDPIAAQTGQLFFAPPHEAASFANQEAMHALIYYVSKTVGMAFI